MLYISKHSFAWLYKGTFLFNDCKCNLSECDLSLDALSWVVLLSELMINGINYMYSII